MGFSTIGSFIMLFFIIIIMISSIVFIYGNFINSANDSFNRQRSIINNMLMTSIKIENASYNNITDEVSLIVVNDGKKKAQYRLS